jgi:hypothetical protein
MELKEVPVMQSELQLSSEILKAICDLQRRRAAMSNEEYRRELNEIMAVIEAQKLQQK